jgi:hypothetical protein
LHVAQVVAHGPLDQQRNEGSYPRILEGLPGRRDVVADRCSIDALEPFQERFLDSPHLSGFIYREPVSGEILWHVLGMPGQVTSR